MKKLILAGFAAITLSTSLMADCSNLLNDALRFTDKGVLATDVKLSTAWNTQATSKHIEYQTCIQKKIFKAQREQTDKLINALDQNTRILKRLESQPSENNTINSARSNSSVDSINSDIDAAYR